MSNNLPAGCSDRDIPGNRAEDLAIDRAIEIKMCEACCKYPPEGFCCCEYCKHQISVCKKCDFEIESDHTKILERLQDRAESESYEN